MSPTITAHATRAGMILGTAAYIDPEQARDRRLDKRSDIWSFGCVLYRCSHDVGCLPGTHSRTLSLRFYGMSRTGPRCPRVRRRFDDCCSGVSKRTARGGCVISVTRDSTSRRRWPRQRRQRQRVPRSRNARLASRGHSLLPSVSRLDRKPGDWLESLVSLDLQPGPHVLANRPPDQWPGPRLAPALSPDGKWVASVLGVTQAALTPGSGSSLVASRPTSLPPPASI